MSNTPQQILYENDGIKIVAKPSKEYEGGTDYHVYALDCDDFGAEFWSWIGKSGQGGKGKRFAHKSRRP